MKFPPWWGYEYFLELKRQTGLARLGQIQLDWQDESNTEIIKINIKHQIMNQQSSCCVYLVGV